MGEPAGEEPVSTVRELCYECGQSHLLPDNHLYNFQDEVDDELVCHICLQPLLQPMDTPCGHTYCFKCLENFMQEYSFCPMDRKKLSFQYCRKSSLLVRNLLDKLIVLCPFQEDCKHTMQRCELEAHLQNRCPGFRKYKAQLESKKNPCSRLKGDSLSKLEASALKEPEIVNGLSTLVAGSSIAAVVSLETAEPGLVNPAFDGSEEDLPQRASLLAETSLIEIHRDDPEEDLGMRIVGGKDTPLGNIVVQEVLRDSVAGTEAKIAPGDHIMEVNGVNISSVTHSQAISLLRQPCTTLHLLVLQEKGFTTRPGQPDSSPTINQEVIHVTLIKRDQSEPLGIKLIRKPDEPGIFILDLLDGGLASKNGKLSRNDRVLSINGQDLRQGTPETAAQIIQTNTNCPPETIFMVYSCATSAFLSRLLVASTASMVHLAKLWPRAFSVAGAFHRLGVAGAFTCHVREGMQDCFIQQSSEVRVNFVVLHQSGMQLSESVEDGSTSNSSSSSNGGSPVLHRRRPEQNRYRRKSSYQKALPQGYLSQDKVVTIKKEPKESLGITIGGGRDSKHRLPIYVTSVQPVGCLFRDGRIKKGDVLLSINNIDLTHLSYNEAVSALKSNAALHTVVLKALEIIVPEKPFESTEMPENRESRFRWASWTPMWVRWLGLPSYLHFCQDIILHKSSSESWGFSIVGGFEENKGSQPFFIKTIVPGTPAFRDRRLRCGDEIVAVNGVSAVGMSNAALIPMLKEQRNKVTLTVVSWPGSLV